MLTNILLDELPSITPHGYNINTDYRQAIKFELLMQDNNIDAKTKIALALNLFYELIDNPDEQLEDIIWFFTKGKKKEKTEEQESNNQQIYSYEYDADYIFSAFLEIYGIDLNNTQMHWWKFKALFNGLQSNTKLVEIMGYRAIDLSKISDKTEKKRYQKLKEIYKLPDMRTQQQKEADFGQAFW